MNNRRKYLSIVIPCYNEEEVLPISIQELIPILEEMQNDLISDYQIVFANNGSKDNTLAVMLALKEEYKKIKIVDLRNNFGYQSSISAGLFHADGDVIISIDADLQDDPAKIKDMVDLHYQGYDMVLGVRDSRSTDSFFKRIFSQGFYILMQLLGANSVYNHGDFRLLTKELVQTLNSFIDFQYKFQPKKASGFSKRVMDISLAKKIINYKPNTSLRDGLQKTWEWFKMNKNEFKNKKNYFI